jgi:hypothetical protein
VLAVIFHTKNIIKMKEFKGTKGEWKVAKEDTLGRVMVDFSKHRGGIDIWDHANDSMTHKESYENAKLIASAPDLLEALQDLARFCEENEVGADLSLAGIAIKKALG